MACPICNHPTVTARSIPLELYGQDGTPLWRIPQAQWQTCGRCGAGWYPEGTEHLPQVPIPEHVVPAYDASDD